MSTLSIKIGAVLDGSFNTVINGSSGQLSRLGATIKELGSSMNSITRFKKLSTDLASSKKSWMSLTKQARSLAKEVQATGKPTKTLVSQFNKANLAATKAKEAFLKKQEALHKMSQGIKDSGRDIKSFINSQSKLETSIGRVRSQFKLLNSATQLQGRIESTRSSLRSKMVDTAAIAIAGGIVPIKFSIDIESALDGLKSVGKLTDDQIMKLGKRLKELSREIPLSTVELVQIAISGVRLGLKEEEIIPFTKTTAKMAVNFGMTVEEIVSAVSNLSNIYGIKTNKMKESGDTLNHLASNTTVEAKDMMSAMSEVAGAAKQFGLDFNQTAGLVNTFISLGKQPRKAAGVISDILIKLLTAREQGPEFIGTLEEARIDIDEFEEDRKKDPEGTLFRAFEALSKVNKDDRPDLILRLFDQGAQRHVALIVDNLEKYKEVKKLLADEKTRENSLEEEYKDHVSTTANQLRLLRNSIAEVGMSLGSVMLPNLKEVAEWLQGMTRHIVTFIEAHPIVTKVIMNTMAILIGLKVAVVGLSYFATFAFGGVISIATMLFTVFSFLSIHAIPAVVTGMSFLKGVILSLATTAFPLLSSAIPAVVTGIRFLTAAIVSNPIGAIIALLASGAILVISNWEKVKNFFASFWEYIKSIIKPIGEAFSWMGSTVSSIFSGISENGPIFEKRESVVSLVDGRAVNELSKNSIFSGVSPLVDNNVIKGLSKSNLRITSVMEEKGHTEENRDDLDKVFKEFMQKKFEAKEPQRTQNITNNFTISIKTEPNQDVRSIANAVIERLREQARGALFDTIEEVY